MQSLTTFWLTSMTSNAFGFDSSFLRKLESLSLQNSHSLSGSAGGSRRSPRHGSSMEFADFRNYTAGDDIRRIDWNGYARLDRLFLRLYTAEERTTVNLVLDHSTSMAFGTPSKAFVAAQLAAIFAFVSLHHFDHVAVLSWGTKIDRYYPPLGGKAAISTIWRSIEEVMRNPASEMDASALRQCGAHCRGQGISIVLSDFLTDSDWRAGLRALRMAGQQVTVIQILEPTELEPDVRGDWTLCDSESSNTLDIDISAQVVQRYRRVMQEHVGAIRDFCRQHRIGYAQITSDVLVPDMVMTNLRTAGVLG